MHQPRNETEDLLLSLTKNSQTLIHQTYRKPQETLELKLIQPRKTFSLKPSINLGLDYNWTVGLPSLEVYNFIFSTQKKNRFEIFTDNIDKFSCAELKEELEEILSIADITPEHLQHEKLGPRIIQAYKKLRSEKSSTDGHLILIMG